MLHSGVVMPTNFYFILYIYHRVVLINQKVVNNNSSPIFWHKGSHLISLNVRKQFRILNCSLQFG